ncbi:hypothetical protein UG54_19590, partial [Gordonia sihwensis]
MEHAVIRERQRGSVRLRRRQGHVEGTRAPLPVDERARLLGHGGHREHHVGVCGDRTAAKFQTDHETGGRECRIARRRTRQIPEFHAADERGRQVSGGERTQDVRGVAAGCCLRLNTPDRCDVAPGPFGGERPAGRKQVGRRTD